MAAAGLVMVAFWIRVLCLACLAFTPPAPVSTAESQSLPAELLDGVLGDDGVPLPLDAEGLPARRLSDAELHRVLLHLSRVMDEASLRLARCHAEGAPFGTAGWRGCIERQ